ncbi:hypothetical protein PG989_016133 [Apiospora arundinis]
MPVGPALGPGVDPVEFDMVKGGTAVGLIVPGTVFPVPVEPGGNALEFEVGNGGSEGPPLEMGTVCPAGLLSRALLPGTRDMVRLGAGCAVVNPELPVGPGIGEVMFDRGNGGLDSEDVISDVSGIEAPVLKGAVPDIPPVGATVWPPGPAVVLVRGYGAVENVFTSDVPEGGTARPVEFEAIGDEADFGVVADGPPGMPENGVVELLKVAVKFPVGKGGMIDDAPVPGIGLLKPVPGTVRLGEVEELKKPDVSVPIGDIVKGSEVAAVVSLDDESRGAVPVGIAEMVVLGNGNGGGTVEVASSLPLSLPLAPGNSELAVSDPVMVLDAEAVPRILLVVLLPKGYGVELEDTPVIFKPPELVYGPAGGVIPGVGIPCPAGPGDGMAELGLVVRLIITLVDEADDTEPVGPTVAVELEIGNGADVIDDSVAGCGE